MVASPRKRATGDRSDHLRGSVFDRLYLDDGGEGSGAMRLETIKDGVRRDLEALLNTRHRCRSWPDGLAEIETSIINYGVPDLLSNNLATSAQRDAFVRTVEGIIRVHEPRLKSVAARLLENSDALDRTLRFRIEAVMSLEPYGEEIVLDSVVDPASRSIAIQAK